MHPQVEGCNAKCLKLLIGTQPFQPTAAASASWLQAGAPVVAQIERSYADHFYAKHDFDSAMQHYAATIGQLEPSYVIRKFLDAQRIHHLTSYLEQLHEQVSCALCPPCAPTSSPPV